MSTALSRMRVLVTQADQFMGPALQACLAEFAAYLLSSAAACFVGQVFPVCGGWVAR